MLLPRLDLQRTRRTDRRAGARGLLGGLRTSRVRARRAAGVRELSRPVFRLLRLHGRGPGIVPGRRARDLGPLARRGRATRRLEGPAGLVTILDPRQLEATRRE